MPLEFDEEKAAKKLINFKSAQLGGGEIVA